MAKKKHPTSFLSFLLTPRMLRVVAFGALCLLGSFTLGVNTAGDKITDPTYAVEASLISGESIQSLGDVIVLLKALKGDIVLNAEQMTAADGDGDGRLTLDDIILHLENLL